MVFFAKTKYCLCCHQRIHLVGDQIHTLPGAQENGDADEIICGDCYKKITGKPYEDMLKAETLEQVEENFKLAVDGLAKYWFDVKGDRYATAFYEREKERCLSKFTSSERVLSGKKILVSACLLGINCRYNGIPKGNQKVCDLLKDPEITLIPVCPEQLGGLPTPRVPSERSGDVVINEAGLDVTDNYRRGAQEALRIARLYDVDLAILKAKSPSCGCGKIYDGTFTRTLIEGDGVTTQYLKENNILVITENDI